MKLFNGRINRLSYFLSIVILYLFLSIIERYSSSISDSLTIFILIATIILEFSFLARRCHDLNKSGWWSLTILVPFYNIYSGLKLLLGTGDFSDNRFGPPPSKGIKFF